MTAKRSAAVGLSMLGGIIVLASVTIGCIKPKKREVAEVLQQQSSL